MDKMGYVVMNIIVTGAQGFLGRYLVESLHHLNFFNIISTGIEPEPGVEFCDLLDIAQLKNLTQKYKPDYIIHCAALVPKSIVGYNDETSSKLNLQMINNLLEVSSCPIIYISSMTVYGNLCNKQVSETDIGFQSSSYAKSKYDGENQISESGRSGLAIRIPGLFGLPRRSGLVYNLLWALKNKQKPVLPESPIIWSAMHVKDAAESISKVFFAFKNSNFQPINIGYKEGQSINKLLDIVSKIFKIQIEYNINHPTFEFDLSLSEKYDAIPKCDLYSAISKFRNDI